MTPVHFITSEPHFLDHLAPVYQALPAELQGPVWCGTGRPENEVAVHRARKVYDIPGRGGLPPAHTVGLGVCVAVGDLANARKVAPRMRFVFGEHGCGLTYMDAPLKYITSYVGSPARKGCDAIVVPNARCEQLQAAATPDIPVHNIGGSPKMDRWLGRPRPVNPRPVVAISWHFESKICDETRSAFPFYERSLGQLLDRGWDILGHAHPRMWSRCLDVYQRTGGIRPVRHFEEVLEQADLYAVDNSSTLYEFAATGRPVVVINCPRYRKTVNHGFRFWDAIPGLQCEQPADLARTIERALKDPASVQKLRREAVAQVFPNLDGHSAQRFADVIVECAARYEQTVVPKKDPKPYKLLDADGNRNGIEYAVEYEARTHARKLGCSYERIP